MTDTPYGPGTTVWIDNPFPAGDPREVRDEPGPFDEDPKSKYRDKWCPKTYSGRPCYVPALIKKYDPTINTYTYTTHLEYKPEAEAMKKGKPMLRDNSRGDGYDNCLDIKYDNLAELLWNIIKRYTRDQVYTMCGDALIAVNPSKQINPGKASPWKVLTDALLNEFRNTRTKKIDIFDYAVQRMYASTQNTRKLPPHLYSVAKLAVENAMAKKIKSQIILLTGMPGSGKTTNCKAILDYIVTAASEAGSKRRKASDYVENRFNMLRLRPQERHLLAMHAILESFGHCATRRNTNSSRLGKMIKVYFTDVDKDQASTIACAQVEVALLDRSRILKFPSDEERNFNVFYQMLAGHEELQSREQDDFKELLGDGDADLGQIEGLHDKENFVALKQSFAEFGFSAVEQKEIFNILIGLMYFSRVTFQETINEKQPMTVVFTGTMNNLKFAAKYWGVSQENLELMLCAELRNKVFYPMDMASVKLKKDNLMRSMYGSLVEYIVDKMNRAMLATAPPGFLSRPDARHFLGVLDLFGVDNQPGKFNSLEQLLMNYTAEKMHQIVLQKMFKEEEELCRKEGVTLAPSHYVDNVDRISFFDKRATGMITQLDTDTKFSSVDSRNFLDRFMRQIKANSTIWEKPKSANYINDDMSDDEKVEERKLCGHSLVVHHYTGDSVRYNFDGFIKTNKWFYTFSEPTGTPLHDIFATANNNVLRSGVTPGMDLKNKHKNKKFLSVAYRRTLNEKIFMPKGIPITDSRFFELHYVFCIRPNMAINLKNNSSPFLIQRQLESMSIVDIIKHRHSGFVYRKEYLTFIQRYLPIVANNEFLCLKALNIKSVTLKALSKELLRVMLQMSGQYLDEHTDEYAIGAERMFIRYNMITQLQKLRDEWDKKCHDSVVKIQLKWKNYFAQRRFSQMHLGIVRLQTAFRSSFQGAAWKKKADSVKIIDNCVKNHFVRSYFMDRRIAARKSQKYYLIKKQRLQWLRIRRGIRVMHSLARGFVVRQHVLRMLHAVRTIQRAVRAGSVRFHEYWDKVRCCLMAQCHFRGQEWRKKHNDIMGFLQNKQKVRKRKQSVATIGAMYKTILVRNRYREIREAAFRLQHRCRTLCVRNQLFKAKDVAEQAQKMIRGFNARRAVEKMRSHNMVEDERWRLKTVREREQQQLAELKSQPDPASNVVVTRGRRKQEQKQSSYYAILDVDVLVDTSDFYPQGWTQATGAQETKLRASKPSASQCRPASVRATLSPSMTRARCTHGAGATTGSSGMGRR